MALEPQKMENKTRGQSLRLAIVLLNWNGLELLKKYMPSICEFSDNHKIFVIDNASTDESVTYIENYFQEISIIKLEKNYGFAKGYNKGLKQIDADILCLVNNDIRVTKNWIKPILTLFDSDKNIDVIQPKILSEKQPKLFEYAGAGGGYLDTLGYPYCRGRVFWDLEEDKAQYNDTVEVFWASGACFFIRKKTFDTMKGFDEDFFAHQEEIDLCWRLQNNSKKIYYCGESTVFHLGGATLDKQSSQKTYLNIRNSLLMLLKNLPKNRIIPILFLRMVFDGISSFYFAYHSGFGHFAATIKAHLHFYRMIPKTIKKREKTQKEFGFKKLIPLQFFLMKRTTWNELK